MESTHLIKTDIVVAGGGLVGLVQTLALARNGCDVICVDQADISSNNSAQYDARTTAISYGSHLLLKQIGLWDELLTQACPINDIQILDGNSPSLLNFGINEIESEVDTVEPAFGWIIENYIIRNALYAAIKAETNATYYSNSKVIDYRVDLDCAWVVLDNQEIQAQLIIGADGRQSFTREWMGVGTKSWSYNQKAIVSIIEHTNAHNNIAVEHFKSEGPFAVLPMKDDAQGHHRSSIVWTNHGRKNNIREKSPLDFDEKTFLAAINTRLPKFYGGAVKATKIAAYPLTFNHAFDYIKPRMALIGDAAHGIHPIAGQGLNLGLRDVKTLTDILSKAYHAHKDIGDMNILKEYKRARMPDNIKMASATDLLNKIFSNNILPLQKSRKLGLKIISRFNPAKKFFMRQAMGLADK